MLALALAAGTAGRHHASPLEADPHAALGNAGFRTVASGERQRWGAGQVKVVLDPSLDAAGDGARDAVEAAFGTWLAAEPHLPDVALERASDAGRAARDGVNRVVLAPIDIPGHEQDVAVTIGYADSSSGQLTEADIVLNSRYVFGDAHGDDADDTGDEDHPAHCSSKRYDVQSIATHEIGHFYGLGEDMGDSKATMFIRSAPCETHKRALEAGDVAAIGELYASSDPSASSPPPDPNAPVVARTACSVNAAASPIGGRADDTTVLVVLVLLTAAGASRRREIVRMSK